MHLSAASSVCTSRVPAAFAPLSCHQRLHLSVATSVCTSRLPAAFTPLSSQQRLHLSVASSVCTSRPRCPGRSRYLLLRRASSPRHRPPIAVEGLPAAPEEAATPDGWTLHKRRTLHGRRTLHRHWTLDERRTLHGRRTLHDRRTLHLADGHTNRRQTTKQMSNISSGSAKNPNM